MRAWASGQFSESRNRKAGNFHREAFGAQTAFVASRARDWRHVLREPFAVIVGLRFFQVGFKMCKKTLEIQFLSALAIRGITVKYQVLRLA